MNAEVSRRVFVGSVAAGLPLVAGTVHGIRASTALDQVHDHSAAAGDPDPVLDHVVRELAAIHNRIQLRGAKGEDARAVAAQLRTALVHSRQSDINARSKKVLADLIDSRGRDAVLYLEVDTEKAKARLKQYGIAADTRWFDTSGLDYETRNRIIDELLTEGLDGMLSRTATVFDSLGAAIDRRGSQVVRASLMQRDDADWWIGFCTQLQIEIMRLGMDAAAVCAIAFFIPAVAFVCAMTELAIVVQSAVYFASCV